MSLHIENDDIDFEKYEKEIEAIVNITDVTAFRDELAAIINGGNEPTGPTMPWGKTHDHIRFRGGEITTWFGMSGHGKSAVTGMIALHLAKQGMKVCIASFEMKPVHTLYRMLRQVSHTNQPSLGINDKFLDWASGKIYIYDHVGRIQTKRVFAVIKYAAEHLGITQFFIDSLMMCVRGEDDYNGQKEFMEFAASIARALNVHIHIIHHTKKLDDEDKIPGKFSAKGSGAISDITDQFLSVWRNKKKERELKEANYKGLPTDDIESKPDAVIRCDKNRHGEWEGDISLWFDPASLQYRGSRDLRFLKFMGEE